jgi:Cu-Zn family superoxide dismutase
MPAIKENKMKLTTLAILILSISLSACSSDKQTKEKSSQAGVQSKEEMQAASAELKSPDENVSGEVTFKETEKGIRVVAEISGLKPRSVHGFHIHEKGKCEGPDFKSAGGHFNPHSTPHSGPGAGSKHAGDFGNVVADDQGKARKELLLTKHDLKNLSMVMNKAVVLHASPDDLVSQPSGNAGDRMACGIIESI